MIRECKCHKWSDKNEHVFDRNLMILYLILDMNKGWDYSIFNELIFYLFCIQNISNYYYIYSKDIHINGI